MARCWHKLLTMSIVLCTSLQLPPSTCSLPIDSSESGLLPMSDFPPPDIGASRIPHHHQPIIRDKRAHQAYIRYLRQRKMRQAEERELREKLASKIVPPAATTPGSFLSRLPLPRLPPINTTAIMARIPPSVLMTVNNAAMSVMQRIPPEVMGAIGAARQAIPVYIEQLRGPVTQAVAGATAMGQQLIGTVQQGYRAAKSGDLMPMLAGMMGMGGPPPPGAGPVAAASPGSRLANLRQMAAGLMAMPEPEPGVPPNRIAMVAQRVMGMINSNPQLRNLMAKVMSMMPTPEPAPSPKKS